MKTRPGLRFIAVVPSRTGHVVNIYDVGGAFWNGCDDPKIRWRGWAYRRQRVGSWEVRIFIWTAGGRVQPGSKGKDRQWGRPDLGVIFFLIGRGRWVPDLVSAEPVHRVLCAARGDIGTLAGAVLWSLF